MKLKFIAISSLACLLLGACNQPAANNPAASIPGKSIPENMHLVTPITGNAENETPASPANNQPQAALQIKQGQFFSYALPPGWQLGEDGQFALSLVAADKKAYTVMVGNAGILPDFPAASFVYEKMMAMRPQGLQLGEPRQSAPVAGFQYAYSFEVSYQLNGEPYRGIAICHVAPYYGGATMAMTAAISVATQWASYASWLPAVSRQVAASNGAAFGMRGLMQQNLRNSMDYAEAARAYRSWSAQTQKEVTDYRNAVNDKQQEQFRDNIGGVQRYNNPYSNGQEVQLSNQYKHYWINRQGQILGTDNPGVNPNTGSTEEWQKMDAKN
jgi:hypothetical protein